MPNVMRWRYGETNPVVAAVAAETAIEIGDLLVLDAGYAKPASDVDVGGEVPVSQEAVHDKFLGVAMQASPAGEASEIRVASSGVFEFDQTSASVTLGARIAVAGGTGNTTLAAQHVVAVADNAPQLAIGRCAKQTASAPTILVAIKSTVMNDGPQAVA